MKAKKSLGQNFLKDENVLKRIANIFETKENDLIIEIGPGKGALTKHLINKKSNLLCIELDTDLMPYLDKYENSKTKIIYNDILKVNLKDYIPKDINNIYVIANIPYYITTPIIEYLTESNINIKGIALLIQKEVAERYSATPESKEYGYITVYLNHFYNIKKEFDVPKNAFNPIPKVDSSLITLIKKEDIEDINFNKFNSFIKEAFSMKRKALKNNLKNYDIDDLLLNMNKTLTIRAEELSYNEFLYLFKRLNK